MVRRMKKEFTGKSLEEVLEAASAELGISKDEIKYEDVSEGGFLGLFKTVKITVEVPEASAAVTTETVKEEVKASAESVSEDVAESVIEAVKKEEPKSKEEIEKIASDFVFNVLAKMDLEANVTASVNEEDETVYVNIDGPDMGVLIGKRGQTLDSLQYLTSLVINRHSGASYLKVRVDTENYRERRKATLENLAKNISQKVRRTRRSVTLEPMNPYERRIIHSALQNDKFVETYSEGEEPYRKVVVAMKKDAPRDPKFGNNRGGRYGNNRGGRYNNNRGGNNYGKRKPNYPRHNEKSDDYSTDYKADYAAYLEQKAAERAAAENGDNK